MDSSIIFLLAIMALLGLMFLFLFVTSRRRDAERVYVGTATQVIVELAEGSIVGVEALIRWKHPRRGLVGPVDFFDAHTHVGSNDPDGFKQTPEELLASLTAARPEANFVDPQTYNELFTAEEKGALNLANHYYPLVYGTIAAASCSSVPVPGRTAACLRTGAGFRRCPSRSPGACSRRARCCRGSR